MFRRMVILSIVCVCALAVVSAGQERVPVMTDLQHQFDRNQDGFVGPDEQVMLREFSEARERIEKLLAEAREAEARARLMRAAARAEREGRDDEANELRQQARKLAVEAEELGRQRKDRGMIEQIDRLHAMAADAKAAGQYDRADAIYREAKEMERNLKNAGAPKMDMDNEQRNRLERQVEQLRDEMNGLRKEIEELKEVIRNKAMER